MNASSSSPKGVRGHSGRGGAEQIAWQKYNEAGRSKVLPETRRVRMAERTVSPVRIGDLGRGEAAYDGENKRVGKPPSSTLSGTTLGYDIHTKDPWWMRVAKDAIGIKSAGPRGMTDMPYYLRDDNEKSNGNDLTRPARDYESDRWRPRSPSHDTRLQNRLPLQYQIKRDRMRSVSPETAQSHARGSLLDAVNIIWNPSSPRDTTVHLELGIEDDIEIRLEEFSRLVRLGHFKEAEQHFKRHLVDHISLEPVLLEYTDMLLDRGNYTKYGLHSAPTPGSDLPVPAENYGMESEHCVLNSDNFGPPRPNIVVAELGGKPPAPLPDPITRTGLGVHLRSVYREFHSKGLVKKGLKTAEWDELLTYINSRKRDRQPCSSDLQILQYYLKVLSCVRDKSSFVPPSMYFNIWSDRPDLYKSLLLDERIWDVRDIISASVSALGNHHTWRSFIGADIHSPTFFATFLHDWNLEEYDESSYLATLDILATVGQSFITQLRPRPSQQTIKDAKRVLEHARRFSTCIKDNNPEYIKSRPYLRWMLAEAELARHLSGFEDDDAVSTQKSLRRFPGPTFWLSALPIYIPISSENPGWCASTLQDNSTELLQAGLKAARELGDYHMEASFLRELICRSKDPKELLTELGNLQRLTQGDMVGYLQTCLTKYLPAHDEAQLQALRDELAAFEDQLSLLPNFTRVLEDPLMEWCKRMIQSALFRFKEKFTVQLEEAQGAAVAVAADLPRDLKADVSNFSLCGRMVGDISLSLHQGDSREIFELERNRKELEAHQHNEYKDEAAKLSVEQGKQTTEKKDKDKEYGSGLAENLSRSEIGKKEPTDLVEREENLFLQKSTKMSRRDVSLDVLKRYGLKYELDNAAPNSVIIKEPLKYYEKVVLIERSKEIRKRRQNSGVGDNNKQENSKKTAEDIIEVTEIDSYIWSTASDSDSDNVNDSDSAIPDLERLRIRLGQRTTPTPLTVATSPVHPRLLDLNKKGSEAKQPVTQDKKDLGLQVKGIDDRPQVKEVDDRQQVEIVDPQIDNKKHAADDSGNTKNTGLSGHNGVNSSEQNRGIEPPQRPTSANAEISKGDK